MLIVGKEGQEISSRASKMTEIQKLNPSPEIQPNFANWRNTKFLNRNTRGYTNHYPTIRIHLGFGSSSFLHFPVVFRLKKFVGFCSDSL